MKRRLILAVVGGILLVFFALLSKSVEDGFMKQLDFDTTVRLQGKIPARFDEFWEDASFLVSPVVSSVLVVLLTLFSAVDWKKKRIHIRALLIPVFFVLLVAGEIYGKSVVHHPAPPFFMLKNPSTIFPTYHVQEEFSYPSGHAARVAFIGITLLFVTMQQVNNITIRKKRVWGLAAFIFFCMAGIAIGKIYLGHHWLSDIVGGILLGIGTSLISISGAL